jgi:hypothetical protein
MIDNPDYKGTGIDVPFILFARCCGPDPYVFVPPGSGSVIQLYGSGSGSFYHKEKVVRKTLISTVL